MKNRQDAKSARRSGTPPMIRNSTAEFLVFTARAGDSIEVRYEDETIWLPQKQMAALFGVDVRTISEHLRNIFGSNELQAVSVIRKFRIVQIEGSREVSRDVDFYNLDAIISVGYRVNSARATQFRQWATRVLRDWRLSCGSTRHAGEDPRGHDRELDAASCRDSNRTSGQTHGGSLPDAALANAAAYTHG